MPSVNLSLFAGAGAQFFDDNGTPLAGGFIYSYLAGTTTNQAVYTTSAGNVAHSNPIELDPSGRVPAGGEIWTVEGIEYKFVLRTSAGTLIGTYDNINGTYVATALANSSNPAEGDALVGFRQSNANGNLPDTVGRTVHEKLQEFVSVLDFGADPTGATDSSAAFQAALDLAKGANGTALGRSVFRIHVPSVEGGFYRIENTLTIDGTHGLVLFGDGALTKRGNENATIRWFGALGQPIINIRGQTGSPSNPNFQIVIRDLTFNGYGSSAIPNTYALPAAYALAAIYIGPLVGAPDNTLLRHSIIENCSITGCRFGIYSGNPTGLNTDHALISVKDCFIFNNTQAGIVWGTGNSLISVYSCSVYENGWDNTQTNTLDSYMTSVGANVYLNSGYMDLYSYVGAGSGAGKPKDADVYQGSGRMSIINAWSDTHGLFFKQASASQINSNGYQVAQITGVRHFEGGMTALTTPDSIDISSPGTSVISCTFYGNVRLTSGLSGRPICMGINFGRVGATFVGTGVDTQRSLIHHGNLGNFAQSFYGGFDAGQNQFNTGNTGPTTFVIKGDDPGVMEVADGSAGGTNLVWLSRTDDADGSQVSWYMNCYYDSVAVGWKPLQNTKSCWRITFGGRSKPILVEVADPNGSSGVLTFTDIGGWLVGNNAGFKTEANFVPPKRSSDPTFNSGNWWLGGIYYNTTTNKLRVNVGGMTWQDCN